MSTKMNWFISSIELYLHNTIPQTIKIRFNDMEIDSPMTKSVELGMSWFVNKCSALSAKTSVTLSQTNCQFKIIWWVQIFQDWISLKKTFISLISYQTYWNIESFLLFEKRSFLHIWICGRCALNSIFYIKTENDIDNI